MSNENVTFDDILDYPYWRHRICLGNGHVTPGTLSKRDWTRLNLPEELCGKSFLDVGAFDGLHAFEAERRGAFHVTAIDIWKPGGDEEWWASRIPYQRGIELVKEYRDSQIEICKADVMELTPSTIGTFDIVLCSKVLPFVKEPYSAIERLISVTDEQLILESASPSVQLLTDRPYMEFAKSTTYNDNRWWHPNLICLEELCTEAGGEKVTGTRVPNTPKSPEGVKNAEVTQESVVFSRREGRDPVETLAEGTFVRVLYQSKGMARIEYRHQPTEPYRQTWIDFDAISIGENREEQLFDRAMRVIKQQGVSVFVAETKKFLFKKLRSNNGNNLVHVYL